MSRFSRELLVKNQALGKEECRIGRENQGDLVSFQIGMMKMMMLKGLIGN